MVPVRRAALGLAALAALGALAAATAGTGAPAASSGSPAGPTPTASAPAVPPPTGRPNIVFVLTDDLSTDLVPYLPHVLGMQRDGVTFPNAFVTDSLCCPSRSSIFTGLYPHDSRVFTNTGPGGGEATFRRVSDEAKSFAPALQQAGYRTALMGKYLNGYQPASRRVPPGWTEWDVAGNGYPEFDYALTHGRAVRHFGSAPGDYLTDVLARRADAFVTDSARAGTPFFLEVATFAPHQPFVPAPRDAESFPAVRAPRTPDFDAANSRPPSWLAHHRALSAAEVAHLDADYRLRVQSVQAVDRLLAGVLDTLAREHVAGNTYVVFSSDNGFHMGQHRLTEGKLTAFDTDIHVPLVATGPGIRAGSVAADLTANVDLAPTFEQLAGLAPTATVDGRSLVPLLRGERPEDWRTAVLVEHHGPDFAAADPDAPRPGSGDPSTYEAVRTADSLYVSYTRTGEREFYDLTADPYERANTAAGLAPERRAALDAAVAALAGCHGATACAVAERSIR